MTSKIKFLPISDFSSTQLKEFDSGNKEMTNYLHRYAKKNHKSGLSPCIVIVREDNEHKILGYVTISNSTVEKGDPPAPPLASFPNYPIPVTLIGRLAINKNNHRQGLGELLLMHVFFTSARAVRELKLESVGIITDAIDEMAVNFYSKYDFQVLPCQEKYPKRMFIPNQTIFDAVDG